MPVAGDFRTPRLRADVVLGGVVAFAAAELDCRLFGPVLGMGTAGALPPVVAVQLATKCYRTSAC